MLKNWILCVLVVASSITPSISQAVVEISDGSVIGLWHFDNDSVDASGNGFNGTDTNVSYSSSEFKLGDYSAYFVRSSSPRISIGDLGITSQDKFTVSAWIKSASTGSACQDETLLGYNGWSSSGQANFILGSRQSCPGTAFNDRFYYYVYGSSPDVGSDWLNFISDTNINTSWHHIVLLVDSSAKTVEWYLDNTFDGSAKWTTLPNANFSDVLLGAWYVGGGYRSFDGYMDEFVLIDGKISSSTIEALYNSGTGDTVCTTTGCSTPDAGATLCTSEICKQNLEHLYLFMALGIFILAGYLGYKLIL